MSITLRKRLFALDPLNAIELFLCGRVGVYHAWPLPSSTALAAITMGLLCASDCEETRWVRAQAPRMLRMLRMIFEHRTMAPFRRECCDILANCACWGLIDFVV